MSQGSQGSKPSYHPRLVRVEGPADARRLLENLGADSGGVWIMYRKMQHLVVEVDNVQARAAHIIKQIMLSNGGECATPRDVFDKNREPVKVLMMGTAAQFREATRNLSAQPFGLSALAEELKGLLSGYLSDETRKIVAGEFELDFSGRTLVMGVINMTPDSFSDGGQYNTLENARKRALRMVEAGADAIDVGGESTRPGAERVERGEEIKRTVPLIRSLAGEAGVPISIDTYKAEVAAKALEAGAVIINDISGLRFDPEIIPLAAGKSVPVVIMHMQGSPRDMQEKPAYTDVVGEVAGFLRRQADQAVSGGIGRDRIIIDPGIGFGKSVEHNLEIMRRIEEFRSLPYPLLLGTSRKSFIGAVLDLPVDGRLLGTAATLAFSISRGVDMVRVHDVEQMIQVVKMADAMAGKANPGERR